MWGHVSSDKPSGFLRNEKETIMFGKKGSNIGEVELSNFVDYSASVYDAKAMTLVDQGHRNP